jgi:anti-sigma28 factor (negative regulator of flagellin synthesis)
MPTPTPSYPTGLEHIARPASVVLLAETVRAARELRGERIDDLKSQVSEGGYAVPSERLAQRVLASINFA